jgi:hypothetical protein
VWIILINNSDRVKNGLYVATHSPSSGYASANKGFSTDTEDSQTSERTLSEFTVWSL